MHPGVVKMKMYGPKEFTEMAFSILEWAAENNPRRIVIGKIIKDYTPERKCLGKLGYIQICEHEIYSEREYGMWQERIEIVPLRKHISCYTESGNPRSVEEIIRELRELNEYRIGICVRILKKLSYHELFVKLFDRYFHIKTDHIVSKNENMHYWFCVRDDSGRIDIASEFHEMDRKEILAAYI
jgi:hypothetical protein